MFQYYFFHQNEVKKAYCLLYKFDSKVSFYCYLMGTIGNKKLLKWFAFILKFETILLFIKIGEMTGIFLPLQNISTITSTFCTIFGITQLPPMLL